MMEAGAAIKMPTLHLAAMRAPEDATGLLGLSLPQTISLQGVDHASRLASTVNPPDSGSSGWNRNPTVRARCGL